MSRRQIKTNIGLCGDEPYYHVDLLTRYDTLESIRRSICGSAGSTMR
uniref:Uncharacterized protein n=1 Tax=Lepeophtheirus salmonis TaxID=72036 RepID=A0A0K2UH04_LEPSM